MNDIEKLRLKKHNEIIIRQIIYGEIIETLNITQNILISLPFDVLNLIFNELSIDDLNNLLLTYKYFLHKYFIYYEKTHTKIDTSKNKMLKKMRLNNDMEFIKYNMSYNLLEITLPRIYPKLKYSPEYEIMLFIEDFTTNYPFYFDNKMVNIPLYIQDKNIYFNYTTNLNENLVSQCSIIVPNVSFKSNLKILSFDFSSYTFDKCEFNDSLFENVIDINKNIYTIRFNKCKFGKIVPNQTNFNGRKRLEIIFN